MQSPPLSSSVRVSLGSRSYTIHIGRNLPLDAVSDAADERVMLVTDSNVAGIHAGRVAEALRQRGADVTVAVIQAGEGAKCFRELERLCRFCAQTGIDRHSTALALGGGVVGDLAGFLASVYLRGIKLIQMPTSLLAMVDSSVGGKTGINIEEGKNLVGAFHQPASVFADLAFLDTLPEREYRSGLAETIKYGAIDDLAFFQAHEVDAEALRKRDSATLERFVRRCCEIKADVVGDDETESGRRAILNFGHTLGHAIEATAGYGALLHGEAVSIGMCFAARVSQHFLGLPEAEAKRIPALLSAMGLPVSWRGYSWEKLEAAMRSDKKSVGGVTRWVLLETLGRARHGVPVPDATLRRVFESNA